MITFEILLRALFSIFFVVAGITHFTHASIYDSLVPTYLPNPRFFHLISGFFEIFLGLSLLTRWKSTGAIFLALFLAIVYLGNLHMWINDIPFLGNNLSTSAHVLRLIAQILMILYALYIWRTFK